MKSKYINKKMFYDGAQLRPLYAYENFNVLGDSIISWQGGCDVSFDHMVDYEDKLTASAIRSDLMLHFIIEVFDKNLFSAVSLQRLFASIAKDMICELSSKVNIYRSGDDLYVTKNNKDYKLSISIASISSVSSQIHFALNCTNKNTPVPTCSLGDLKIDPILFSKKMMNQFVKEYKSITVATQKVKPL